MLDRRVQWRKRRLFSVDANSTFTRIEILLFKRKKWSPSWRTRVFLRSKRTAKFKSHLDRVISCSSHGFYINVSRCDGEHNHACIRRNHVKNSVLKIHKCIPWHFYPRPFIHRVNIYANWQLEISSFFIIVAKHWVIYFCACCRYITSFLVPCN